MKWLRAVALLPLGAACGGGGGDDGSDGLGPADPAPPAIVADVTRVDVIGAPGAYTFAVTVASPDSGCGQYADWWEVLTPAGDLVYRRVLLHSHVAEQPFRRSGGPVAIGAADTVWVRAHMNVADGYGGAAMRGTSAAGFAPSTPTPAFPGLAAVPPLPEGCAF